MKIQKPLPGMTPEETERQLYYMNAVVMFKVMHPPPDFCIKIRRYLQQNRETICPSVFVLSTE